MNFPFAGQTQDILKGSIITIALFLAYVSLPVVGMPAGMVAPLPGAFYTFKRGKSSGLAIVVITAVLLAVVADIPSILLYLLQTAVISLSLPFFLERGVGGMRAIVSTVAVNILLILAVVMIYGAVRGVDVHGLVQKGIETSVAQTASLYEKGGIKGEDLEAFRQAMQQAGLLIARIYPALLVIALGTIAGVTLAILARMQARLSRPLNLGELRLFRNPDPFIWLLIAPGFAMLVNNGIVVGVALNILIVVLTLYFFQGLAIIQFYFGKLNTPSLLRYMFYLFLVIQPYLAVAVAALGIFDLWGNFRTPRKT